MWELVALQGNSAERDIGLEYDEHRSIVARVRDADAARFVFTVLCHSNMLCELAANLLPQMSICTCGVCIVPQSMPLWKVHFCECDQRMPELSSDVTRIHHVHLNA